MERALLDRIDVGIYLSAGGLNTRYRILRGTQRKDRPAKIPRAFFYDLRNPETTIIPLTPEDILYTWTITDKIPMDQEALRWIAFFTNLPNTTVRTFKQGAYWSVEKPSTPSARPTIRSKSDQFIDPTVISYKGSKSQMTIQTPATVGEAIDEFSALDAMNRPLGSRSELSLRNLLRSVVFVTHVRNRRAPLTFIVNDKTLPDDKRKKNRYKKIEMIINHLPYVLDHRVNIGVETDIQQNFLNFAHFIKYFFIPQVFWNERRHEEWLTAMDVMNDMKLVKADGTKKEDDELRTEWLQKFMAAMGETGRQDTYFAEHIQNDPFMTQLYILAGTTVE